MIKSGCKSHAIKVWMGMAVVLLAVSVGHGSPIRGIMCLGAGGEDWFIAVLQAENSDGCQGAWSQMIITLRPEADPNLLPVDLYLEEITFRINFDPSLFTYETAFECPAGSSMSLSISPGYGYVDVTFWQVPAVAFACAQKHNLLRMIFTPTLGTVIGHSYDFTLSNVSIVRESGLGLSYQQFSGRFTVTDTDFYAWTMDRQYFSQDTRARVLINGAGFSPDTDAQFVYSGITSPPCDIIPALGVQNEGTTKLYAMFDFPTGCTGMYYLWLGRRGGEFEDPEIYPYQYLDTAMPIVIDSDVEPYPLFTDVTNSSWLAGLDCSNGLAVGDYDNDGDEDLFMASSTASRLMRNNGNGTFTDMAAYWSLTNPAINATWADIENDGDLDLLVQNNTYGAILYRNDLIEYGGVSFTDITSTSFPGTPNPLLDGYSISGMAWADIDNDGDLDLFLACSHYSPPDPPFTNDLYLNDGSGVFTEISAAAGICGPNDYETIGGAFGDYNRDGYQDLFLCNGPSWNSHNPFPNSLYHNNGNNTFTRMTNVGLDDHANSAGVVWVDFDNDGWLDLHVTNVADYWNELSRRDFLFRNNGNGTFTESAVKDAVMNPGYSLGASWADWYLQGEPQPLVAVYYSPSAFSQLNRQQSGGVLPGEDVARRLGTGAGSVQDHTVAWLDYDNSGTPDYIITGAGSGAYLQLFQNNTKNYYSDLHYLNVRLNGQCSNKFGVGARIEAMMGSETQVRYITAGDGYLKQDGYIARFGFGYSGANTVALTVHWPSGMQTSLPAVATDQTITVSEFVPDSCEDNDAYPQACHLNCGGDDSSNNFYWESGLGETADYDWFWYKVIQGFYYTLRTYDLGTRSDTYLELYGQDGTTMLAYDDDGGGGLASLINWTATGTGTYYARVRDYWSRSGCSTDYKFSILGIDSYEDDDTTATVVTSDGQMCRHIFHDSGDADWSMFLAEAGQTYTLETHNLGIACDTFMELYDPGMNIMLLDDNGGIGLASKIVFEATESNYYYIVLYHTYQVYGEDTEYDFNVSNACSYATPPGSGSTSAFDSDYCAASGVIVTWSEPQGGWNDGDIGVREYVLYRDLIALEAYDEFTFETFDYTAESNTSYSYHIEAVNECGLRTSYSAQAAADYVASNPGSGSTLAIDRGLVLYNGVLVSWGSPAGGWGDSGFGTRQFQVYRDGLFLDAISESTLSYEDYTGTHDQLYTYQVWAINGCGLSSNYASCPAGDFVQLPENLHMTKSGSNIVATWSVVSGADRYHLYAGAIGSFYGHQSFFADGLNNNTVNGSCSEPVNNATFAYPSGNLYFLIVAGEATGEGPTGFASSGLPRPGPVEPCQP